MCRLLKRDHRYRRMQQAPEYGDVVTDVIEFLDGRIQACMQSGIAKERILVDPGFGFGKTPEHNLMLIRRLSEFACLGVPLLLGVSRKSTIGEVLDRPVDQRLYGSIALAVLAAWQGAAILRVHDVSATVDALRMTDAVRAL